jgi:DHA1 family multidrug resistance protein-like MFS transporter
MGRTVLTQTYHHNLWINRSTRAVHTMAAIFREAPFGQISRLLLGPRIFKYADERIRVASNSPKASALEKQESGSEHDLERHFSNERAVPVPQTSSSTDSKNDLVDWSGPEDPDNPQNWSTAKKTFTFFQICLLTFSGMYRGLRVVSPVMERI